MDVLPAKFLPRYTALQGYEASESSKNLSAFSGATPYFSCIPLTGAFTSLVILKIPERLAILHNKNPADHGQTGAYSTLPGISNQIKTTHGHMEPKIFGATFAT